MQVKGVRFTFSDRPWRYEGKGTWVFVSLPQDLSSEIRGYFQHEEEGWGRLKCTAEIGKSEWQTAIWFDTKLSRYILPLKTDIRRREKISLDEQVQVNIWI